MNKLEAESNATSTCGEDVGVVWAPRTAIDRVLMPQLVQQRALRYIASIIHTAHQVSVHKVMPHPTA